MGLKKDRGGTERVGITVFGAKKTSDAIQNSGNGLKMLSRETQRHPFKRVVVFCVDDLFGVVTVMTETMRCG